MQLYLDPSNPAAGNNNGDTDDAGNIFEDAGSTIAHGSRPTSSDDVKLMSNGTTSSIDGLTCGILDFNNNQLGASCKILSITKAISSTGNGNWNLTTYSGTYPILASGIAFNVDPGGKVINDGTYSGNEYNASNTHDIADAGASPRFAASGGMLAFSGLVALTANTGNPIMGGSGGTATFSGGFSSLRNFDATGPFSGDANVTFSAGTNSIPAFTTGTVSGGTLTTTTFTGTQSGGTVTLTGAAATYHPTSYSGGTVNTDGTVVTPTIINSFIGVSVTALAPTYTDAQYVLAGQTSGADGGTLTLPDPTKVKAGEPDYGVGGNGSHPSYSASGGGGYIGG